MTAYTFVNSMKMIHKPITALIAEDFLAKNQYYINKIPMGSIRVPFNLDTTNDIYSENAAVKFSVRLLTRLGGSDQAGEGREEDRLKEHFEQKYGGIKLSWNIQNDYMLSFISPEHEATFMKDALDSEGYGILNIGGSKYLVSSIRDCLQENLAAINYRL